MSQDDDIQPFPAISPRDHFQRTVSTQSLTIGSAPRRRRKSSSLPGEPRGDTGAGAFATLGDSNRHDHQGPVSIHRTASEKARPHSKRRKAKTLLRRWKSISLKHTWLNPLILTLLILTGYAIYPSEKNPIHSMIFLSYPLPRKLGQDPSTPIQYGKGARDFAFVAFYTIVLSFTREFIMQRVIRPIAIHYGMKSRAKQSRFMEQFYTAIYFGIFGPFGLYVMSRSPVWYFNTRGMYEGFPHRSHEALFKAYYLLQAAYWSQQAIVLLLLLEKPRKDFKELVAHHIITIALIWLSYRFHFTYMGIAVYITHDISDFFLATSKVFNYLEAPIVGPYFVFFIGVWAYCRHYLNLRILFSIFNEFATVGPFEVNWETQQYKCPLSQYITFALLASLQSVNLFWFVLILRIAKNYVITSATITDERSESGSDDEAEADGAGASSTQEKREAMVGKMATMAEAPQVLLNGIPVEENGHGVPVASSTGIGTGIGLGDAAAEQRRTTRRKA